jgi:hypothetical protein
VFLALLRQCGSCSHTDGRQTQTLIFDPLHAQHEAGEYQQVTEREGDFNLPKGLKRGMRRASIVLIVLATALASRALQAQQQKSPTLGGHIAFVLPLVTDSSGNVISLADAPAVGFPMGITVKGGGRTAFDLEFVPQYNATGPRLTTLTVHPGLLWSFRDRNTSGVRHKPTDGRIYTVASQKFSHQRWPRLIEGLLR